MKCVIASGNEGKLKEFKKILQTYSIELFSAKEMNIDMDKVIEDGESFQDNAIIKARYVYQALGEKYAVIADDSGLVLEAYPDLLSVHSARFMEGEPYSVKNEAILKKYQKEKETNRNAHFVTNLAFIQKNGEMHLFEGRIEGKIAQERMGESGFGYDPIFVPKGYKQSFAQMGDMKDQISHRAQALKAFEDFLSKEYVE